MQKGFAPILIILLIALVVGGILLYQKQTKPAVVPQPTPSAVVSPVQTGTGETTSWKTYTNQALKFTFNYPTSGYVIAKEDIDKVIFNGVFQPGNQVVSGELVLNFKPTINLQSLKNCKETVFQDDVQASCVDGDIATKEFNGVKMNVFYLLNGSRNSQSGTKYVIQLASNPGIEFVRFVLGGGTENSMDQILSTFKFLDTTEDAAGRYCGGFKEEFNQCPAGYKCEYDGDYPDAGGKCIKS